MTTATIIVKGMTCSGCVNSVTKALKNVEGVQEASVDLEGQKATVTFDETKTNLATLKEAIEDAGYDTE
ncbi:heavy-metal-associated domain-containing protein [Alicyclobacillus acidocaldarius]|uniref:Copper chaperone CopZ n=1 Tax=Alicyclobacillus acidocaldarius subsp. acidocaldarius (strain ATCC 27009 / DSM 446 / BCRC 14685 / JCM 5260 / KCTC 1825 / NBRC 15652 / NCIMB 11725 / NRRL B-14509 / 104-IA) TaxID=521098 RepID=C8WVM7_ALIAD|nr:copper ion binding protein [Alicyclobacillus acidocaldarius]ACV58149.1 Heavy metal transport/detoxification protein [Alicyclobacillus acidocaldarius subsp. acidocaldarius DSM 446]